MDRGAEQRSITSRIVDAVRAAIESGELEPGERLLPTRDLAELAGVNHLTAVRAYKRLRELGLVHARVGSGTYVRDLRTRVDPAGPVEPTQWQRYALPEGAGADEDVLVQAMGAVVDPGQVMQMALGYAPLEVLPAAAMREHIDAALDEMGPAALQYLPVEGAPALRAELARLAGDGERADDVLVVTGATQGLGLAVRALVRPGDAVACEDPTFAGSLDTLRASGARLHGVPVDDGGLDVDALEGVLARTPLRMVVLQSALQNPTGTVLAPERARRLVALARRHGFFILDDEVWAPARLEDPAPLSRLRSRDRAHVIATGSASKVAGGGLRLGWVRASGPVMDRLVVEKRRDDLASNGLMQHAAARWLATGGYERQAELVRAAYRERWTAFERAAHHLEGVATFGRPRGGACVWLTVGVPAEEQDVVAAAASAGVAVLPGSAFAVEPPSATRLRVTFGMLSPDEIETGVRRLAHALRSAATPRRATSALPVM